MRSNEISKARKLWIFGEGTQNVSSRGKDGQKTKSKKDSRGRKLEKISKKLFFHLYKGLNLFSSMWQSKGGCKVAFDLPSLLRALAGCMC